MSKNNKILPRENFILSGGNYRRETVVINGFVEGRAEIKKAHLSDEK